MFDNFVIFNRIEKLMQKGPPMQQNSNAKKAYTSEQKYYALANAIAKDAGIKTPLPEVPIEVVANNAAEFFKKRDTFRSSSEAFQQLQQSWRNIVESTNQSPLQFAMGGQLFACSIDDEIKMDTKKINPSVMQDFITCAKSLGAKPQFSSNGELIMRREDVVKASIIYRLRHPNCSSEDEKLYQSIVAGVNKKDQEVKGRNSTYSTVTSVLMIGSMCVNTLMTFGVLPAIPALTITLMAIQTIMLLPKIVALCRSLKRAGYNEEAEKIQKGFERFKMITDIVAKEYETKTQRGFEAGVRSLRGNSKVLRKETGILTGQQQVAMNSVYNNYPPKQADQSRPKYNLNSEQRCMCV